MSEFKLEEFLIEACHKGASDIHLKVGKPPAIRILNNIVRTTLPPLSEDDLDDSLKVMLYKYLWERVRNSYDIDFTYEITGVSRFRVNYCRDLGMPKLTLRVVPYEIPSMVELHLPESLKAFTAFNNGIILVTGATGTGKSTTIASLIDSINQDRADHIITLEDPIEFLYSDKKSIVTQRQIGIDIDNFADGVKYAMRQDPDVILVGEIRDKETLDSALSAAETGHLVLSTLHTNSAVHTISRIVNMYDDSLRGFARERIAHSLRGTIAQKLIPGKNGGRVPALEMMTVTPAIQDYITKNKLDDVSSIIKKGGVGNLITMNKSIFTLFKAGIIDQETAIDYSDDPTELQQMMRGIFHGTKDNLANDIL